MSEPTPDQVARFIADGLPCRHVEVEGDGRHFFATIVSADFRPMESDSTPTTYGPGARPSRLLKRATVATAVNGDAPIEAVMATPAGKAAMEKVFPDIPGHVAYEQFKGMSLRQLAPLAGGLITDEKIAAFEAEVKAGK